MFWWVLLQGELKSVAFDERIFEYRIAHSRSWVKRTCAKLDIMKKLNTNFEDYHSNFSVFKCTPHQCRGGSYFNGLCHMVQCLSVSTCRGSKPTNTRHHYPNYQFTGGKDTKLLQHQQQTRIQHSIIDVYFTYDIVFWTTNTTSLLTSIDKRPLDKLIKKNQSIMTHHLHPLQSRKLLTVAFWWFHKGVKNEP